MTKSYFGLASCHLTDKCVLKKKKKQDNRRTVPKGTSIEEFWALMRRKGLR